MGPCVAVAFVLPVASGSVASPHENSFRVMIAFSFTGTLICNALGAVGGGYVRSRRKSEFVIRGLPKKRSSGSLAFEQHIFSIRSKCDDQCEASLRIRDNAAHDARILDLADASSNASEAVPASIDQV